MEVWIAPVALEKTYSLGPDPLCRLELEPSVRVTSVFFTVIPAREPPAIAVGVRSSKRSDRPNSAVTRPLPRLARVLALRLLGML